MGKFSMCRSLSDKTHGFSRGLQWPRQLRRLTEDFLKERIKVVQCRSWREVEQARANILLNFDQKATIHIDRVEKEKQ